MILLLVLILSHIYKQDVCFDLRLILSQLLNKFVPSLVPSGRIINDVRCCVSRWDRGEGTRSAPWTAPHTPAQTSYLLPACEIVCVAAGSQLMQSTWFQLHNHKYHSCRQPSLSKNCPLGSCLTLVLSVSLLLLHLYFRQSLALGFADANLPAGLIPSGLAQHAQ